MPEIDPPNIPHYVAAALLLPAFLADPLRFDAFAADLACPGPDSPRNFAHLALCAAAILLRAAALIFRRLRGVGSEAGAACGESPLSSVRSSAISPSNCSMRCSKPSMAAMIISSVSFFGMFVETSFQYICTSLTHFVWE